MTDIRPFRADDIEQVTRLHQKVFPRDEDKATPEVYDAYFRDTFLTGPWPDSGLHSLVCEEPGGISGFLGVVPLRLAHRGRLLWATLCTQFCVDPGRRGMTGLKLILDEYDLTAGDTPYKRELTDRFRQLTSTVFQRGSMKMQLIELLRGGASEVAVKHLLVF